MIKAYRLILINLLLCFNCIIVAQVELVINNCSPDSNFSSYPKKFIEINGLTYFSTNNLSWYRTNGTSTGTEFTNVSFEPISYSVLGKSLFFIGYGPTRQFGFWKTDFSGVGTVLLKKINSKSIYDFSFELIVCNQKAYFLITSYQNIEIWEADELSDACNNLITLTSNSFNNISFVNSNNSILMFYKKDTILHFTLINGNSVKDIIPNDMQTILTMYALKDRFYIIAKQKNQTTAFFITKDLEDITQCNTLLPNADSYEFENDGENLFLLSEENLTNKQTLFKYNNTNNSINEYFTFSSNEEKLGIIKFIPIQDKIIFVAYNLYSGICKFYRTEDNYYNYKSFYSVHVPSNDHSEWFNYCKSKSKVFISAGTMLDSSRIWVTEGDLQSTKLLKDNVSSNAFYLDSNDQLYFSADDSNIGNEPWITDGTVNNTRLLKDINQSYLSSMHNIFSFNNNIYFTSLKNKTSREKIWLLDENSKSACIAFDTSYSDFTYNNFLVFKNRLFFCSYYNYNLWYTNGNNSNGTFSDTKLVKTNIITETNNLCTIGNRVFFIAGNDNIYGKADLFSFNTIDGNLSSLKEFDFDKYNYSLPGQYLTQVGDNIYFVTYSKNEGTQLLKSNGTEIGNTLIFGNKMLINSLFSVANKLYFFAFNEINGRELWVYDEINGANLVKSIGSGQVTDLTAVGDKLFFVRDSTLWVSDGSETGTHEIMLKSGLNLSRDWQYKWMINYKGYLFFTCYDNNLNYYLLRTDVTDYATSIVYINHSSPIYNLSIVNNLLLFITTNDENILQYFFSDGSISKTAPLPNWTDVNLQSISSPTLIKEYLYFTASHPYYWNSIFRYKLPSIDSLINSTKLDSSPFTIFPNPAKSLINVASFEENTNNLIVEFYTTLGILVKTQYFNPQFSNEMRIDISDLQNGAYIVKTNRITNNSILLIKEQN